MGQEQRPIFLKITRFTVVLYTLLLGCLLVLNMSACIQFLFMFDNTGMATPRPKLRASLPTDAVVTAVPPPTVASSLRILLTPRKTATTATYRPSSLLPMNVLYSGTGSDNGLRNASAVMYMHDGSSTSARHVEIQTFDHLRRHLAQTPFQSRQVILGLAAFIDTRYLAIFVKSARAVNASTEIFLFLDKPSMSQERIRALLLESRIHVIEYDKDLLEPPFLRNYHPSSNRWVFYHRFFSNYAGFFAGLFDRAVACDVRDVHFSADPFQHLEAPKLPKERPDVNEKMEILGRRLKYTRDIFLNDAALVQRNVSWLDMTTGRLLSNTVDNLRLSAQETNADNVTTQAVFGFKEEDGPEIAGCAWNSGWISSCFGQVMLDAIGTSPISCSGVVLGRLPEMVTYLQAMADTLLGKSRFSDKFPSCERNGVDQGVHNVLLHTGLVPGLHLHTAKSFPGVVSHMQSDLYVSLDGGVPPRIINSLGDAVSIVHQYDRISALQESYASKYVTWTDVHDLRKGWENNPTCGLYRALLQADMLKGSCEFGSLRSLQPDMCCDACTRKTGCTSFTFTAGVCWFKKCSLQELSAIYVNYTLHAALDLPMTAYTVVADTESMQPVPSLVLSGIPNMGVVLASDARHEELIADLLERNGRAGNALRVGSSSAITSNIRQLARNYRVFVKELEADNAKKPW